jgi:hypothetical protein
LTRSIFQKAGREPAEKNENTHVSCFEPLFATKRVGARLCTSLTLPYTQHFRLRALFHHLISV